MSPFSDASSRSSSPIPSPSPPPPPPPSPPPSASTNAPSQKVKREGIPSWMNAARGITVPTGAEERKLVGKGRRETIQAYTARNARQGVSEGSVRSASPAAGTGDATSVVVKGDAVGEEEEEGGGAAGGGVEMTPERRAYQSFLQAAQHRRLQRHDLHIRAVIWEESTARTRARLAAVGREKEVLEGKLARMERRRGDYVREHPVEVSLVDDEREERRWEEWLRAQRGPVDQGDGEGTGEEEGGGVDI